MSSASSSEDTIENNPPQRLPPRPKANASDAVRAKTVASKGAPRLAHKGAPRPTGGPSSTPSKLQQPPALKSPTMGSKPASSSSTSEADEASVPTPPSSPRRMAPPTHALGSPTGRVAPPPTLKVPPPLASPAGSQTPPSSPTGKAALPQIPVKMLPGGKMGPGGKVMPGGKVGPGGKMMPGGKMLPGGKMGPGGKVMPGGKVGPGAKMGPTGKVIPSGKVGQPGVAARSKMHPLPHTKGAPPPLVPPKGFAKKEEEEEEEEEEEDKEESGNENEEDMDDDEEEAPKLPVRTGRRSNNLEENSNNSKESAKEPSPSPPPPPPPPEEDDSEEEESENGPSDEESDSGKNIKEPSPSASPPPPPPPPHSSHSEETSSSSSSEEDENDDADAPPPPPPRESEHKDSDNDKKDDEKEEDESEDDSSPPPPPPPRENEGSADEHNVDEDNEGKESDEDAPPPPPPQRTRSSSSSTKDVKSKKDDDDKSEEEEEEEEPDAVPQIRAVTNRDDVKEKPKQPPPPVPPKRRPSVTNRSEGEAADDDEEEQEPPPPPPPQRTRSSSSSTMEEDDDDNVKKSPKALPPVPPKRRPSVTNRSEGEPEDNEEEEQEPPPPPPQRRRSSSGSNRGEEGDTKEKGKRPRSSRKTMSLRGTISKPKKGESNDEEDENESDNEDKRKEETDAKCKGESPSMSSNIIVKKPIDKSKSGSASSEDSDKITSPRDHKKEGGKGAHHPPRAPHASDTPDIPPPAGEFTFKKAFPSRAAGSGDTSGDDAPRPQQKFLQQSQLQQLQQHTPPPSKSPARLGTLKAKHKKNATKPGSMKKAGNEEDKDAGADKEMLDVFVQKVLAKYNDVKPDEIAYNWYKEVSGLQTEFINEVQKKKKKMQMLVKEGFLYRMKATEKGDVFVRSWAKINSTSFSFCSASQIAKLMTTTRFGIVIPVSESMQVEEADSVQLKSRADAGKQKSNNVYGFTVVKATKSSKKTVLRLFASSVEERQEWMEFIRICIKRVSDPTYGLPTAEDETSDTEARDIFNAPCEESNEKLLAGICENNSKLAQTRLNSYDSYEVTIQKTFSADVITSIISVLIKGDEEEEVLICDFVVTKFRIFIFQKAHDTLLHSFHMLLIKSINFENGVMTLNVTNLNAKKKQQLHSIQIYTNSPLTILHNMYNSLKNISQPEQWPELLSPKLTWVEDSPHNILDPKYQSEFWDIKEAEEQGIRPRDTFVSDPILAYQSQCCLNEKPVNQCIIDYIAYLVNNDKHELDMTACIYGDITMDDLICLRDFIASDNYFKSFVLIGGCGAPSISPASSKSAAQGSAVAKNGLTVMAPAASGNKRLTRLVLRSLDDEEESTINFCTALSNAMSLNQLCMLDLSGNTIKDGGAKALSQGLMQMSHGLMSLSLSGCGIGSKGFQSLFGALRARVDISVHLRDLDISNNKLDDSGTSALCEWFKAFKGGETEIRKLNLAQTKLSFENLIVLPPGLKYIDVSGNQITQKGLTQFSMCVAYVPQICAEDFVFHEKGSSALVSSFLSKKDGKMLNLSRREVKQTSDTTITTVLVDTLETDLPKNLKKLYLSGLSITRDLFERMVSFLVNAGEIEILDISCPYKDNIHGCEREWAENIESLILECDSLTCLNLSGGYGPKVLLHVIQSLRSVAMAAAIQNGSSAAPGDDDNGGGGGGVQESSSTTGGFSLCSIDVSKNDLGDAGAIALADLIRADSKSLMRIVCDKNGFSFAGFLSIVSALDKNGTLLMIEANENLAQIIQSLIGTPVMSRMNTITGTLSTLLERNISKTPVERIPRFISRILQDYSCPWVSLFNSSSSMGGNLRPLKPAPNVPPKIVK